MNGTDAAKMILNLVFEDNGGDFTNSRQKEDYMSVAVPYCKTLISENFPFGDPDYMFGLIVAPTYSYKNGEEVLEFDGDLSILSEKTMGALAGMARAIEDLF